jgi:hypothetical protein
MHSLRELDASVLLPTTASWQINRIGSCLDVLSTDKESRSLASISLLL